MYSLDYSSEQFVCVPNKMVNRVVFAQVFSRENLLKGILPAFNVKKRRATDKNEMICC